VLVSPLRNHGYVHPIDSFINVEEKWVLHVGAITPMVRNSSLQRDCAREDSGGTQLLDRLTTRARVELLTTLALFNTRETVAVGDFCSMSHFFEVHWISLLYRVLGQLDCWASG